MNFNASVRRAFGHAAPQYDAHASQQRQVMQRLAALAADEIATADWLLDAGCGTGALAGLLPAKRIIGLDAALGMCAMAQSRGVPVVAADMAQLPFTAQSVPAIFSSLALQWCEDLPALFTQWAEAIQPQGALIFSTYLLNSLNELDRAFKAVDEVSPIRPFQSMDAIISMINSSGFTLKASHQELLTREDKSLIGLMKYMKVIGAGSHQLSRRGLKTRRYLQSLEAAYPKATGEAIQSSWHVGYVVAIRG